VLFHLEPSSGIPLYQQIVDEVKAATVRGLLKDGDRLPSVRELARTLGINPTTVVKAYDQLARERLIVLRQGLGAFVTLGREALPPGEREEKVEQLALRLAVEGRRHGYSGARLVEVLKLVLRKLRPRAREKASP
jgi:GntR family transcriptional regulator